MNYLTLSWDDLHNLIFDLSQKIQKEEHQFDLIVAIARGGLSISHILSDFLKLPITSFTISSYLDLQQKKAPEISFHIGNKLHNKRILLVDDVSDSGKTFIRGIEYLKELGAEDVKTAAIFTKPWTEFIPDFYDKETDAWVIFPFEMRETVTSLSKKFKSEGKTIEEIKLELQKIKIPSQYIEHYTS
jgi:uncharacterized protein